MSSLTPQEGRESSSAAQDRLQFNPGPLEAVERRDNVTGIAAVIGELRQRTREDRLRVWLALGGTEDDFPERAES